MIIFDTGKRIRLWKPRLGAAGLFCLPFIVKAVKQPGYLWLYRADCCRQLHLQLVDGILLRILCFLAAAGLFLTVLVCAPGKRLAVTRIGGDTLPINLLHVIPVGILGELPCFSRGCSILFPFLEAAVITAGIWLIFSWFRPLYGVTESNGMIENNKTNVRKTIAKQIDL
ncbi:MAG: hypothetical protein ACI4D3_15685 [Lachnospiraceae bacterium]